MPATGQTTTHGLYARIRRLENALAGCEAALRLEEVRIDALPCVAATVTLVLQRRRAIAEASLETQRRGKPLLYNASLRVSRASAAARACAVTLAHFRSEAAQAMSQFAQVLESARASLRHRLAARGSLTEGSAAARLQPYDMLHSNRHLPEPGRTFPATSWCVVCGPSTRGVKMSGAVARPPSEVDVIVGGSRQRVAFDACVGVPSRRHALGRPLRSFGPSICADIRAGRNVGVLCVGSYAPGTPVAVRLYTLFK